uniref:Uncharacterized protein n=1 Tax=Zea mays TaxID=4577 RepID=B4G0S6_MAIZE|nr:unknown [Zea mays]
MGPARPEVRRGGRVQRVLRGPAPRAPHRVRERVGDLVRRRQGQERDQYDVPLPGVVPDGEAAAALHQHLLRRRARRPLGRRREGLRRNHLLVHRQPIHDHHRRSRHREVPERGRPTGARLGAAGVRRVDPAGLVLAQERDGQAAEPAAGDLLQLRRPELRAPAQRAAQLHGPGRGRRHRAAARVRGRRGHRLRHGPRRGQRGQGQQRARRPVRGAQRDGRPRRHVLGADGRGRAPERVLDRAAAAAGRAGAGVQRGADPGARGAGAARGAARGVRGRRARGQRHDGGAQATAPAALPRRGHDGEGLDHGAAWPAAALGGGPTLRPLRRVGHDVTWRARRAWGMIAWCNGGTWPVGLALSWSSEPK